MELNYGLQLYSVRDFTGADMEYALSHIAEYGYKSVEFAGFFGHSAAELSKMLSGFGLAVIGEHFGLDAFDGDRLKAALDSSEELGNKNIVVVDLALGDAEEAKKTLCSLARLKEETSRRGMKLHFHTHSRDFMPNKDGDTPLDIVLKETDLLVELDTFWAFCSGRDPVNEFERLAGRCELCHIKDGKKDGTPAVVGEGAAPVVKCVEKADELGIYKIVESDGMIPDGLTDVRHCLKYLRKLANGEITG